MYIIIAYMRTAYKKVALVIPVYNEAMQIRKTIESIPKSFDKLICVDDGSVDDSSNEIKKTRATLLRHCCNLGQGAALQTGIEFALLDSSVDYIVTFDADGQHQISDVIKMIEVINAKKVDIVLGSRFLGKAENMGTGKKILLKLATRFSNFTSGVKLTDTHNGLRVMNRDFAQKLKLSMHDFSHASEIIEKIQLNNAKFVEYPVTIVYSDYSKNKGQSAFNAINIIMDLVLNKIGKK